MATEYDARRPRLPVELAQAIDAKRGQVPFNRFVVEALEKALDQGAPFPVVTENLKETPRGEVVAADPAKPVRYEQQRPPVPYRKPFVPRPKGG